MREPRRCAAGIHPLMKNWFREQWDWFVVCVLMAILSLLADEDERP